MWRDAASVEHARDGGFSIVEVITAMTIFLIVSTAAIALLINGLQAVRENADRVNAASVARSHLEELRSQGAETITPGRTTTTANVGATTYTVTTSATWVTIDQTVNSCSVTIDPDELAFMRVHVEVTGGSLSAPQDIDGLVPRLTEARDANQGSISVRVIDHVGVGVPGVTVTLTNVAAPAPATTFETDADGCLLVPGIAVSALWRADIARAGYVAPTPAATTASGSVTSGQNTPFSFAYAPAASLRLTTPDDTYAIPASIPLTLTPDDRFRTPSTPLAYPLTINELYPDTYQAWLGTCSDAGLVQVNVAAAADAQTRAELPGIPVQIVAAPGTRIRLEHRPFDGVGSCPDGTLPDYAIGTVDDSWVLPVLLPTGDWRFTARTADDTVLDPVPLFLDDTLAVGCGVVWDTGLENRTRALADAVAAEANRVADDTDVTRAILRQAATDIVDAAPVGYAAAWEVGPTNDEVTLSSRLGAVTAAVVVRITSPDPPDIARAEPRNATSVTIGDPPTPFVAPEPCVPVTP